MATLAKSGFQPLHQRSRTDGSRRFSSEDTAWGDRLRSHYSQRGLSQVASIFRRSEYCTAVKKAHKRKTCLTITCNKQIPSQICHNISLACVKTYRWDPTQEPLPMLCSLGSLSIECSRVVECNLPTICWTHLLWQLYHLRALAQGLHPEPQGHCKAHTEVSQVETKLADQQSNSD